MILELRNPHSVLAALERRPEDVLEVRVPPRGAGETWQRVADLARASDVRVVVVEAPEAGEDASPVHGGGGRPRRDDRGSQRDDKGRRGRGRAPFRKPHQDRGDPRERVRRPGAAPDEGTSGRRAHVCAQVREKEDVTLAALVDGARERDDGKGLWLAVDCVQDPRNLGAIFRSAAFFGVRGMLLTRDRSAPLTAVSYDAASGGLEVVPFAYATNLSRDMAAAREAGLWILGAASEAGTDVRDVARDRPWMLVLGNEEKGLRRLTREGCDELCRITPRGDVEALNVSVAAGVLLSALAAR